MRSAFSRFLSSPYFRVGAGLVISAVTLYLAVRNVGLQDVRRAICQADLRFALLALISVVITLCLKSHRWRMLLSGAGKRVAFIKVCLSFLSAQMLNAFLPLRVGEISRISVIGARGLSHAFVLGTIAVEKALDLIAFSSFLLALLLLMPIPKWMGESGYGLIALTMLIALMVYIIAFHRNRLVKSLDRLIERFPDRVRSFAAEHLYAGLSSMDVFRSRTELLKLALETALIWSVAALTNYLVLLSFNIAVPLEASLLILIALQAGITIPALPGRIGIFEYICVLALGVFGVERTTALSYGILLHVIVYLPVIVLGLISLWYLQLWPAQDRSLRTTNGG